MYRAWAHLLYLLESENMLMLIPPFHLFPLLQPSLADFQSAFQVVFVDPSGHLNMCADMTACTYKQVGLGKHLGKLDWLSLVCFQ